MLASGTIFVFPELFDLCCGQGVLSQLGRVVRGGQAGTGAQAFPRGSVRFSIGPFNTEEHVEAAIKAVAETAAERCSSAT